jgi:hypothetical protein
MKKVFGFCTLILFLTLFFLRCEKNPNDPVIPATLTYSVHWDKDTVSKGYTVFVEWTSENATAVDLEINGGNIPISVNGSKSFVLYTTSTFLFTFIGEDTVMTKTFVVFVETVPPPPEPPVIELPDSIHTPFNTSINIIVQITGATSTSSDLPGFSGLSGGIFSTPILMDTVIYHFFASNEFGTAEDSIIIFVDPPLPPTFMDFITEHPWSAVSGVVSCMCDEGPWYNMSFSQEQLDIKYFFKKNGTWEGYLYGILVGNGTFSIVDSILIWGAEYQIKVLNSTTMTIINSNELTIGCPGDVGCAIRTYVPTTL